MSIIWKRELFETSLNSSTLRRLNYVYVRTSITEKGVIVGSNSWIKVVIAEVISTVIIQNGAESNWVDHRRHTKS